MTASAGVSDVLIVGGGPAGCAAALSARAAGLAVTLVARRAARPGDTGACWVGPAAVGLCTAMGVTRAAAGGVAFAGVRLCGWDFKQPVHVDDADLAGWIVAREQLGRALHDACLAAGVSLCDGLAEDVQLGERDVTAQLADGTRPSGRVLVLADGAGSRLAERAQLVPARMLRASGGCAMVSITVASHDVGVDVLLAGGRTLKLVTIVRSEKLATAMLMSHDGAVQPAMELRALLAEAAKAGLWPGTSTPAPSESPLLAGAALELETHVGKRSLLIGAAGGFVAAFSNEGLYPALRSGQLAAETVVRALRAPHVQDELATFSAAWRGELAEYLRLPNTDLGLLMPMVFNNPQMSRRVARAFLLGQAF